MAAATQITICIDRQNRVVTQVGASVNVIPPLSQRDLVPFLIQIADPPANPQGGTATILTTAVSAGSIRLTVSQKATGTGGDSNTWLLAQLLETGWTWDNAQKGFTGSLNLNTTQMEAFIADAESASVEFEVRFSQGGVLNTLLPGPLNRFTVYANDDEGLSAAVDIINGIATYTAFYLKDPDSNSIIALTNVAGVLTPIVIHAP